MRDEVVETEAVSIRGGHLPNSVSPSLGAKSEVATRPVMPWAFLLPHWPRPVNLWSLGPPFPLRIPPTWLMLEGDAWR